MAPRYRFGFVLTTGAGNRTRFANLMRYAERDAEKAAERSHLTAAQAARLAHAANVRALYLTHLSGRYTQAEIEAEARAIFPAAVVAQDFDRVVVKAAA